ncbi:MAG: co-chaperone YbbN [Alphaproteobacteria bacterium]|nr:MAG: co-chaperone YbbN [Alphaproteobacteria bacterium]
MNEMIAGSGDQGADAFIKSADIKSFGPDVVVASRSVPVIVDFWADWCGPCKQLMPALEDAVKAHKGAVHLVKVNADQNQTLCAQLQVQSLPTVLAFWQGQPVDGFQGAIPPSQVKMFVDRLAQLSGGAMPGGEDDDPLADALAHAGELMEAGQVGPAAQLYQQILQHDENNIEALVGLAEAALKLGQADQVPQVLEAIDAEALKKDTRLTERVNRLKTALELAEQARGFDAPEVYEAEIAADSKNHQARYNLALAHQARGDMAAAAEALLGIIMRDREWQEDAARKQLVKLFEAAGPTDPFTLKYRRRLSSVLFS